jgi:hypothetical protein
MINRGFETLMSSISSSGNCGCGPPMIGCDTDFIEWIKRDPQPSLQELAVKFGSYVAITLEAWVD